MSIHSLNIPRVVKIFNPSPFGSSWMSGKKARKQIARGRAFLRPDGQLQFKASIQVHFNARKERESEADVLRSRSGVLFWNGARARYDELGRDKSMFLPGCNVQFKPVDRCVYTG